MNPPQVYMCSPSRTLHPPPSPNHPSGSAQCTSPKHPALCTEPGLATRFIYDIIHVSMPFSQIIPPSLSHRVQKTVLYICVSFAVSHTGLLLPSFKIPNFLSPISKLVDLFFPSSENIWKKNRGGRFPLFLDYSLEVLLAYSSLQCCVSFYRTAK